ncbi:PspC domain-containing protein [uncultured Limosilactobacillus sp.]|uniref:PspC domain-containing protein n=1 Tax=uncultured Limosilactobacillus sp. TaxID=2837629 RepID=UPI0025E7A5ED|nr:PspC domain-containing protein [uncultured Limosilactobacillus sp.]
MSTRRKMHKQLTKSNSNRIIAGVLGGIAEYWNVKPNVVRVVYLVLTALTSFVPGIVIYLMLAVLMPDDPHKDNLWKNLASLFSQGRQHDAQTARKELHDVEEKDL